MLHGGGQLGSGEPTFRTNGAHDVASRQPHSRERSARGIGDESAIGQTKGVGSRVGACGGGLY
jgi:hypothetical protein